MLVVVVVVALVQVRRRGSKLQNAEDPRAGVDGPDRSGTSA